MDDAIEVERSVEVGVEPNEVWEQLVDGELSEEWMGVRIEPRVGGDVLVPDRDVIGTVEDIREGESITWSWRERDGDPSQVTIDLVPIETGTRVDVVERLLDYEVIEFPGVILGQAA